MSPELHIEPRATPPYVSFATFKSLVSWLETEGVPHRFDRSFWQGKFSGSRGTQLVAALRFLGLLQGYTPQPDLEQLVHAAKVDRKDMLARLLATSYRTVRFDELHRATPAMVKEWFSAYPIDGDTLRKALSFFVSAAKEADIPLSNTVRKMARGRAAQPSDRTRRDPSGAERPARSGQQHCEVSQATVQLASGGTVTLSLAVDLFKLSPRDREFVLRLVDLTRSYSDGPHGAEAGDGDPAGDV